jgi:3-oxoacyl-[acyl-carrier-protein] synthase-3
VNAGTDSGVTATVSDVAVAGVVSAIPKRIVRNEFFEAQYSKEDIANVVKMIGVSERRWVNSGETTADLCLLAARDLMAGLGWAADDIGILVFVSQTPDYALPATACVLHGKLGLGPRCASFDVNLGCSGYVYGLWLVSQLMRGSSAQRALLLVGDTSYYNDTSDRATAMVFGDAGTATAVERRGGTGDWHFVLGSDGSGAKNLIVPKSGTRQEIPDDERMAGKNPSMLFMDGSEIFNFTLRSIPPLGEALFDSSGVTSDAFGAFLFHQANTFMIKHLTKKMKLPPDKVPMNMDRFGNTSSASIPLLMCDVLGERLHAESMRLAMFGFGVGYSWAAADIPCGPLGVARIVEL